MRKILIVGATSLIAQEAARCFAKDGAWFCLVGRNGEKLSSISKDLSARGSPGVNVITCDPCDTSKHSEILLKADEFLGGVDTVIIAYGSLSEQKVCEFNYQALETEFRINFLSIASWVHLIAEKFEKIGSGSISVIGSVAGDRGRKSNYVYGTAKAALSTFLQGVRNRLSSSNVHVLTIKPGFVDTPMTSSFKKGILFAKAETVGAGIYDAINKRKDIVYLPWFWRFIMLIVCSIPERFFKKLSI